ncbi:MAG: hypothetical protein VX693_06350 [Pseudomonadota bacterium]|nr:hypothetical protein [Pseudomonadota bacterium]
MGAKIFSANDKKSPIIKIIILLYSLPLILMACSNKNFEWQNPKKLEDYWPADISKCKIIATTQLNRQLDIENDANFDIKNELKTLFEKLDAEKKYNSYYTDCLKEKGYQRNLVK